MKLLRYIIIAVILLTSECLWSKAIVIRDHSEFVNELENLGTEIYEMSEEASETLGECWDKILDITGEVQKTEALINSLSTTEYEMINNDFLLKFADLFNKDSKLKEKLLDIYLKQETKIKTKLDACLGIGTSYRKALQARASDFEDRIDKIQTDALTTIERIKDDLVKLTSQGNLKDSFNAMTNDVKQEKENMKKLHQYDIPLLKFDVDQAAKLKETVQKCYSAKTCQPLRNTVADLSKKYLVSEGDDE